MKENNKGFSLIELIVVIGMFAIVGAMIVSFVATSSRTYTNVSAEVNVQEEAQLTLNQIKDLVIDTNRAVSYGLEAPDPGNMKSFMVVDETNTEASIVADWIADGVNEDYIKRVLVVYSEESTQTTQADGTLTTTYTYPIMKIIYNQGSNELYYAEHVFADTASIDVSSFGTTAVDLYLLSEYVTNFSVDLANIEDSQVDMNIDFSSSKTAGEGKEYSATPTINLRNKVIVSENLTDIYTDPGIEVDSFVVGVDITKDGSVINGDSIQLGSAITYGAQVEVQYGATEAYTWSLVGDDPACVSTVTGSGLVNVPLDEPSGTLTLTATAVGDTSKKASIPIVLSGELRPTNVSVSYTETAIIGGADDVRKIYTFSALTTYTDGTTITGENITWTPPSNLPASSYYSISSAGELLLYLKADAGQIAYTITATSDELNIAGDAVIDSETVIPGDLTYTPEVEMIVQITPDVDTIDRGDDIVLTASVSDFTGDEDDLIYDWEILEAESVGFSGSGTNSVSHVQLTSTGTDGSQKNLEIDKELDWSTEFTIKIKVTAHDDTEGVEQSDSYIASFTVLPVELTLVSTRRDIKSWRLVQTLSWSLDNIVISRSDWYDMSYDYVYTGEGYQNWGDYHDVTFEDSDFYPNSEQFEYLTGKVNMARWPDGGYLETLYIKLEIGYFGNTVMSSNTLTISD